MVERALEQFLADVWQEVLGVEGLGAHDDFFELGGDSIRGAVVVNRVAQALGEPVSIAAIFEAPTVAGLAVDLSHNYPDAVARLSKASLTGPGGETPDDGGASPVARAQQVSTSVVAGDREEVELSSARPVSSRVPAWLGEGGVDFGAVEAVVLEELSVQDCLVLARETVSAEAVLVAYVVVSGPFSPDRLREHVSQRLPGALVPSVFVSVSVLPLTVAGQVDESALCRLAVPDAMSMGGWEEWLGSSPDVAEALVVSEERVGGVPRVHLDDLLPERKGAESVAAAVDIPEGSSVAQEGEPMALAGGGELIVPERSPQTLTEALLRTATEHGDNGITFVGSDGTEKFESYAALLERARCMLAGLQARGLGPGDRAILQVDALEDHYAAFWACVLGGIAPATVAVAPSYAVRNGVVDKLFNAWRLLGRPPILTSRRLVAPIAGLTRLVAMQGLTVYAVEELEDSPPAQRTHHSRPDDVAFLQLTSGSTGVPKCIQEAHCSVVAHAHAVRQCDGYTPDGVSLNWMPVDHVGALIMWHLRDTYIGCRQVQVKTDLILADPLKWLDLLEAHGVNYTWSPNFAYKLVADELAKVADRGWDLSRIRFFLNGGEQVTLSVVRDFLDRIAPFGVSEHAMQPAYGGAETCTRITANNHFDVATGARRFLKSSLEGRLQETDADDSTSACFIDLGPPLPGVELRIVDADNELLGEGVIGRLQIRGPVITPGYLDNQAANAEAFAGDGWLGLGDLGFILDGRLTLTGREKETIVVRGANFYCYEVEDVAGAVEGVEPTFTGACAVADPASGTEGFAVFFVPKQDAAEDVAVLVGKIRARVAASLGMSPTHVIPLTIEEFPKTTSGKIQRAKLRRALEAGRLQEELKGLDVGLENASTLPDWFYRRTWRRREISSRSPRRSTGGKTVVFFDPAGLGARLAERERRYGHPCVEVEAGPAFEQLEEYRFRIDPANPYDYRRLLATLAGDGVGIEEVVHLASYDTQGGEIADVHMLEAAQERGACSLLLALQALADGHSPDEPVRLLVVSSYAQPVSSSDSVACEHGPLLGLVRTASKEWPWLDSRHVDLEAEDLDADADTVLRERRAVSGEREVAYRDGQRLTARLEHVALHGEPIRSLPFERGGVYVLTGGLGGVAGEVARYLLERHEAKLVLVGRTPVPDEPKAWGGQGHTEAAAERIAAYRALAQRGGEVLYRSADVADPVRMRAVVSEAEARWGRALDGVIHLAGVFEERVLGEETRESFMASLRPKLQGTWTLHELAKERPTCAFITFSSVNGSLGAFGAGAYAAANAFLDSFAHHRRHAGLPSTCFAWSLWQEVGMARAYPPDKQRLSRAAGFLPIAAEQGLHSLLAGLHRDHAHLLVGLDATAAPIRSQLEQPAEVTHALRAYVKRTNGSGNAWRDVPDVRDRFGTPSACELLTVPELPPARAGAIDRPRLLEVARGGAPELAYAGSEATSAPRTPIEVEIAGMWRELLALDEVGIDDDFFALGGHTLLAVRLTRRLNRRFGVELPVGTVLDAPTVARLAVAIMQAQAEAQALPLTSGQRYLWRFEQRPGNAGVNAAPALRLRGPLDVAALEASLEEICARHEALRTTFHARNGEPVQVIRPPAPVPLARVDLRELRPAAREKQAIRLLAREAQRPFDTSRDPMLRATLLRLDDEEHVALLVIHHLACDAWSQDVLFRELEALYGALRAGERASLPESPVQYADHADLHSQRLRGGALQQAKEYWTGQWEGAKALDLPTDRSRLSLAAGEVPRWEDLRMPGSLLEELHALCRRQHVTLFMALMAAWLALLHRYSGQDDICILTPFANRSRAGVTDSIGFFATNLLQRHDLAGDPSFTELLGRVRMTVVDAVSHGELTCEELIEKLGLQALLGGASFFLRHFETPRLEGLEVERIDFEIDRGERGHFGLVMSERDDDLMASLYYDNHSFHATTAAGVLRQLQTLLESVVADPDQRLSRLPLQIEPASRSVPLPTAAPAALHSASGERLRYVGRRLRRRAAQLRATINRRSFFR